MSDQFPHISVTYSPLHREWEVLKDGKANSRRVVKVGPYSECIKEAKLIGKALNQPVFVFDEKGCLPNKIA
jgi:hypothetical protein